MDEMLKSRMNSYLSKKWSDMQLGMWEMDSETEVSDMDSFIEDMKSQPRYNPIEIIKRLLDEIVK